MKQILSVIFIYLLGSAHAALSNQIAPAGTAITLSKPTIERNASHKILDPKFKELRKPGKLNFFSYKLFRKEFIFTNSVNDLLNSLINFLSIICFAIPTIYSPG